MIALIPIHRLRRSQSQHDPSRRSCEYRSLVLCQEIKRSPPVVNLFKSGFLSTPDYSGLRIFPHRITPSAALGDFIALLQLSKIMSDREWPATRGLPHFGQRRAVKPTFGSPLVAGSNRSKILTTAIANQSRQDTVETARTEWLDPKHQSGPDSPEFCAMLPSRKDTSVGFPDRSDDDRVSFA